MNKLPVVNVPAISPCDGKIKVENNVSKIGVTYQQRKSMQNMYSDLFKALLRLPDKQVQQRVLDAINDVRVYKCPKCSHTFQNVAVAPQIENLPVRNIKDKIALPRNGELCFRPKSFICNNNITFKTPIKIIGNLKRLPNGDAMVPPLIQPTSTKIIKLDENVEPKQFIKPIPIEKLMDKSRIKMNPSTGNELKCNLISTLKTEKIDNSLEETQTSDEVEKADINEINATNEDSTSKRKRKRKERVPQVIKKSHALIAQSKMIPKLKKHKMNLEKFKSNQSNTVDSVEEQNSPYIANVLILQNDNSNSNSISQMEHILRTMRREFMNLETLQNGMLPIHHAVCQNDDILLQQHIFLWTKYKQSDLNSLYTEDDEDLLQLAVMCNSEPQIVQILIEHKLDVQQLYDGSNTIIHLAIVNQIELKSFSLLMEKIDLTLLKTLNDDGLSPLHLSLRDNQFAYAEVMLNIVDKRVMGCVKYCRNLDSRKVEPLDYYINMCEQMDEKYIRESLKHSAKNKLLNAREMMTGYTALFYAVSKNMENFIYFLLAHGANPNLQNYSGQDPRSFLGDHGKLLNISLKVDRTMEKVSKVLKKYEK